MAELDPDAPIDYELADPAGEFDVIVGFEYTVRVSVDQSEINRDRGDDAETTGSVNDLICGSGSTGTGDTFNCEPVRIVVDLVTAQDQQTQTAAAQNAAQANQNKLAQDTKAADIALTNELYGPLAPQFRACRDLNKLTPGACKLFPGAAVEVQAGQ